MLENLVQLVKDNAQELVIDNTQVPNEHNEDVIQAATGSITDVLKKKLSSGNLGELISSFTQGDSNGATNELLGSVQSNFTERLGTLGLNSSTIQSLSSTFIPMILSKVMGQNNSGFNIQDILGQFAGADGKFDMSDLTNIFDTKNKEGDASDGLIDKLKGLF